MSDTKKLRYIICFLMIIAYLLHLIQLLIYPIDPKFLITLTGTIAYAIASYGIYKNERFGYYITICFPIAGVIIVVIIILLGFSGQFGYGEINPFTLAAAFVEVPAIILSIYVIQKQ